MIDEKGIERGEDWYNLTCPICGKKFHLKPYHVKNIKTITAQKNVIKKLKKSI